MIKHVGLLALIFLLLLAPSPVKADSNISVLDNSAEVRFPNELYFILVFLALGNIIDARLHYQVDKINYAQVTSEGRPSFTPATRITASWTWDMRKASLPPGAAVTYWWTVKDTDGNELNTPKEVVYFDDNRYHWQNLTDDELTLFWYEGSESFAWELMDACKQGLARLRHIVSYEAWSAEAISRPIKIYVYASTRDLQGAMIFPEEWTGGAAFTDFGIIVIGIPPDRIDWGKRALVHELTHVVVHQATFSPYGKLPTWLDEGLAMYNEGELNSYLQSHLSRAVSEDRLISVRSLCSPFSAESEKAYISYAESYSLVKYLIDNYGQDKILKLLRLFRQGNTYDEALTQVYGFDIDGLDSRWRETLTTPLAQSESAWLHPALIAVLSALAISLVLAGALALEEWTWWRSGRKD